jgi:hypothetical protein
MRIAILACCVLGLVFLAVAGLSYLAGIPSEVSVTGTDGGVIIQNVGNHPCLVVVNSPEGKEQFRLAVDASVTLVTHSNITGTIGVLVFDSRTVPVDLVNLPKPSEGWPGFEDKPSSNLT